MTAKDRLTALSFHCASFAIVALMALIDGDTGMAMFLMFVILFESLIVTVLSFFISDSD